MIKKFSEIYRENETNHLLTGNGFNMHFKYDSSYKNIFEQMKNSSKISRDFYDEEFTKIVEDCKYDIELVLEKCLPLLKERAIRSLEQEDNISLLKPESIALRLQKTIGLLEQDDTVSPERKRFFGLLRQNPAIREQIINNIIPQMQKKSKPNFIKDQMSKSIMAIKSSFFGLLVGIMMEDTEKKRERVAKFIEKFSNSNIFTLNYDSLLYKIGIDLRNRSKSTGKSEWKMNDGFIEEGGRIFWKKGDEQNLFYIHGTLLFLSRKKRRRKF